MISTYALLHYDLMIICILLSVEKTNDFGVSGASVLLLQFLSSNEWRWFHLTLYQKVFSCALFICWGFKMSSESSAHHGGDLAGACAGPQERLFAQLIDMTCFAFLFYAQNIHESDFVSGRTVTLVCLISIFLCWFIVSQKSNCRGLRDVSGSSREIKVLLFYGLFWELGVSSRLGHICKLFSRLYGLCR